MSNSRFKIAALLSFVTILVISKSIVANEIKQVGLSVWSGYPQSVQGFKDALAEAGFIEGKNINYLYKNANANKAQQYQIAAEFKQKKVDLVYSLTTSGTLIIKEVLPENTPIVFSIVTYPADAGLIESLDYSGNNLVGTSNYVPIKNYLSLFHKLLPTAKSVAIFHRKGEPNSKIQAASLTRLFKRKGIKVINLEPENIEQVTAMAKGVTSDVNAFVTTTDTLMQNGGELALIKVAQQAKLPILSSNKKGIEQGSTFGPVADFYILGKMSGEMAAEVLLNNAQPHALISKYQNPPSFLINKAQAKSLNITLPNNLTGLIFIDE